LVRYALGSASLAAIAKPTRILVDSLPRNEPASAEMGIALFDRLIAAKQDDMARGLLNMLAQSHPKIASVTRRQAVLSWPKIGRLGLAPDNNPQGRLRRAFFFDLPGFVWARTAGRDQAIRLGTEADLQTDLLVPGVAACLGYDTAADGTAYVVLASGGRPLGASFVRRFGLADALGFALAGLRILNALTGARVLLPDTSIERFVSDRVASSLQLVDMDGATRASEDACRAKLPDLAAAFCRQILAAEDKNRLRSDIPAEIAAALRDTAPPAELGKLLAMHGARSWDRDAADSTDGGQG
jgi:hypothetical protein